MKYLVQIELFGHKFNVPVEASNETDATIAAHSRLKKNLKTVSVQPYAEKDPRESNARPVKDDSVDFLMGMFGMKK